MCFDMVYRTRDTRLEVDVVNSFVHTSTRQFAVIATRTMPDCERLVIAYSDEKTLCGFLAAPSIVALGYGSREEAEANMYGCRTTAQPLRLNSVATLVARGTEPLNKQVHNRVPLNGKLSLEKTKDLIRRLVQHSFVAAVLALYSRNFLSAAVRAFISF